MKHIINRVMSLGLLATTFGGTEAAEQPSS
jgi:hypothetical protein